MMRMDRTTVAAVAAMLLACSAGAQAVVSPKAFTNRRGNARAGDRFSPWVGGQWTWQALHTDLRGAPRVFRRISFRQGDADPTARGRLVTLELRLAKTDFSKRSPVFAANYLGSPTLAIKARNVVEPDWTKAPAGGYPAPFSLTLPFDAPWPYDGKQDLLYEIRILKAFASSSPYPVDAVVRDFEETPTSSFGQGCVASGRATPMVLQGAARTFRQPAKHTFSWTARLGPAFERSTFLIGARKQVLFIQNLCTHYYVDRVFSAYTMFADANGSFSTPWIEIPFDWGLVGAAVHVQAYSLDNGRHPGLFPVSATNRASLTIPPPPPARVDVATVRVVPNSHRGTLDDYKAMIVEFR